MQNNIQLALAGSQSGYTVTWGEVELYHLGDGTGYVTLNYWDGTSNSIVGSELYTLCGETYSGVVSIYFYAEGPMPRITGVSSRSLANSDELSVEFMAFNYIDEGKTFWSDSACGTITLGADLEITRLSIDLDW